MNNYVEKIRRGDSLTNFHDVELRETVDNINGELSTDTTTLEGNPLNFSLLSAQTAKSTILSVEPIQDLHGYSKPWVGGAGKNLLRMSIDSIKSSNTSGIWNGNVYTINNVTITLLTDLDNNIIGIKVNGTASSGVNFVLSVYDKYLANGDYKLNGCPAGGSTSGTTFYLGFYIQGRSAYNFGSGDTNISIDGTEATGANVYIHAHANYNCQNLIFYPMLRLSTVTDATFEPYTNICPITGRTEIGILGCGKNLLDTSIAEIGKAWNGVVNSARARIVIPCEPSTQYSLSINGTNVDRSYYNYGETVPLSDYGYDFTNSAIFTTSSTSKYIVIGLNKNNISQTDVNNCKLQLEKNNQPTQYTAYQSSTDLTISLGQTVYGGTLDVENGVLVVDRGYFELDGSSDEQWEKSEPASEIYHRRYISKNLPSLGTTSTRFFKAISNEFENSISTDYDTLNGVFILRYINSTNRIDITCDSISSVSDWETYLANNPLQICYELATPITINLTPHTINLLKGVNNISTDGDKITLTYRDGSVATLGDLTSAVDNLDSKIDESKILTDTATGDKYILVVTNGVLDIQQVSN